jgi:hypothetical protein
LQPLEYASYFAEAGYNPTYLHLALNRLAVNLGRRAILAVISCFPPECAFRERERLTTITVVPQLKGNVCKH